MSDVDYHRNNCEVAKRLVAAFSTPRISQFFANVTLDRVMIGQVQGAHFKVTNPDAFRVFTQECPGVTVAEAYIEFGDESLEIIW